MRICLVVHGFPPHERTGVENYTEALARGLVRAGLEVLVFAPVVTEDRPHLSLRREERDGYEIHWLSLRGHPEDPLERLEAPAVARQFARLLDRERPALVHFQHAIKVGLGALFEASERDLPIVYTAHDYFPVCHRYVLLRPDLRHCEVRGDSMACSRCDLAIGYLNRFADLGDWQAGVFPERLAPERRQALEAILADEPERAGLGLDESDAAFDRRLEMDALRARAFARVDAILAPSAWLADELARGGIDRQTIEQLSYGIENADLRDLPPAAADPGRPVRFGFFGGLSKHKGLHVLLEAFGRLGGAAELAVHGYSTDRPWVASLREEAARVGAEWRGPYERAELPGLLAAVDVVVVPSLWVENQPIVIREAFSARRPVIASRLGAIPESVRHGVDGLLFEPGDAASLAAAMRSLQDHEAVRALAAAVAPVKDVDLQVRELVARYEGLVRARERRTREGLPASVRAFAERWAGHEARPSRELLARVLHGLAELRGALGAGAAVPEEFLAQALASGSKTQTELREGREEAAWLRGELAGATRERDWLRREQGDLREAGRSLSAEREWLAGVAAERERELVWRREAAEALERERDWLRGRLEGVERERDWLRGRVEDGERERAGLLERIEAHEADVEELAQRLEGSALVSEGIDHAHRIGPRLARLAVDALEAHERDVHERVGYLSEALEEPEPEPSAERALARLDRAVERAAERTRELRWRREEMEAAARAAERRWVSVLLGRTGLGRIVRRWARPRRAEEEP